MSTTGLPEDVCRFLDAHIPTMEHLDLFLALARVSPESRAAADIAMELRTAADGTEARLDEMHGTGLLQTENGASGRRAYRWVPHSPAESQTVERLRNLYQVRPVTLIRYVYERPRTAAQLFADAFRLRKKSE